MNTGIFGFLKKRASATTRRRSPVFWPSGCGVLSFAFLLVCSAGPLESAPPSIGLLPQDKTPVEVTDSERNPFGRKLVKTPEVAAQTESEEQKIRAVVTRLPFGGITRGYGVVKVLLGSFMVEKGGYLPDVIANQTEKVRVMEVSEEHVELGFVDEDGSVSSRVLKLTFDLKPVVRYQIGSTKLEVKEEPETLGGVKKDAAGTSR